MHNKESYGSMLLEKLESTLSTDIKFSFKPNNVCMICSNKSIVAGHLVSDYANECCNIPTTVTDDERIPGWFDSNTLVILMVNQDKKSQLEELIERFGTTGCKFVTLTDFDVDDKDDTILDIKIESENNFEYLGEILGYLFLLFDKMKMISKDDVLNLLPDLREMQNRAKKSFSNIDMEEVAKKNILIAYPTNMRATAMLWKFTFYSRLKRPTFMTEYPEYNHNEIVGWCMSPEQSKDYIVIFIVDTNTSELLSVISESMIDVLKKSEVNVRKVKIGGRDNLEKNLLGFLISEVTPRRGGKQ